MQNDIEIYLHKQSPAHIIQWMTDVFGTPPESRGSATKGTVRLNITTAQGIVPVMLVQRGSWYSVWFDSAKTPWATDLECAQSAVAALGARARCSDGGWQEGDDPDQFLEVSAEGVTTVIWHDE
ncbi:MAG: hypothetical protein JXQ97_08365 [Natronospirillum sp.]